RALLWGSSADLSLVVGLSLLAICTWANTIGALIPLVAVRFKIDPALISAPLITTLVDATGLAIYLLIAGAILGLCRGCTQSALFLACASPLPRRTFTTADILQTAVRKDPDRLAEVLLVDTFHRSVVVHDAVVSLDDDERTDAHHAVRAEGQSECARCSA